MESRSIKTTNKGKIFAGAIVIIFITLCGLIINQYIDGRTYVTTDNAKITGEILTSSPRIAGKIATIKVKEGDTVKKGDVLFTLETDLLVARVNYAKAAFEVAQAKLNKAVGGGRSQEITGAQSLVDQANAAYNGALSRKESLENALSNVKNTFYTLSKQVEGFKDPKTKLPEITYAMKQLNVMYVTKKVTDAQYTVQAEGIQQMFISKAQLEGQITQMKYQIKELNILVDTSKAELRGAASKLKLVAEGASTKDIAILVNMVKAAKSTLDINKLSLNFTSVRAPRDGTVVQVKAHVGEVISPGFAVMSLIDLRSLKVTAYVLEKDIINVKNNQRVKLNLDAFPGKSFEGKVKMVGLATASVFKLPRGDKSPGNYTKINQGIPVTIDFDYKKNPVIPGMSARAKIRLSK